MVRRLRSSLSFANVVSLLALFVALGGSSYAALKVGSKQITNNSVRSKDLRNNDVRGTDIRRGAVSSSDVKDGSLLRTDFRAGQLPAGPAGATGPRGLQGPAGTASYVAPIPSGTTVRGTFALGIITANAGTGATTGVSLPAPAPVALDDGHVNFEPSAFGGDDDTDCDGTVAAPTAPAGKVCLYPGNGGGTNGTAFGSAIATPPTGTSRFGFKVHFSSGTVGVALDGTWAYTAP